MSHLKPLNALKNATNLISAALIIISSMGTALLIPLAASATASTVYVSNLQPDWAAAGGGDVYSAYYPTPDNAVSPGATALFEGRAAGVIKAGFATNDEGLFGFKPTGTIDHFATEPLSYDFVNQTGTNPVWMTIEVGSADRSVNKNYQSIPATNTNSWHTVNAATGLWQEMDDNGNGINSPMTLGAVANANSGQYVTRAYLRLGMGDSYNNGGQGTTAWVDTATIGEVTYDFVKLPAPTVLGFTHPSLACDAFSNNATTTTAWDGVEGASSYNYRSWTTAAGSSYNSVASAYPVNGIHATTLGGSFNQGEGKYSFEVQSVGTNGNTSDWSSVCGVTYDNTAPSAPNITYPANNSFIANIQHVTWSAVVDDFANPVTYVYQSSTSDATATDGSFLLPAYTSPALSDTQIPTPGTPEGTYYLHVKSIDAAGNTSSWSSSVKVTADNTLPQVSITSPTHNQVLSGRSVAISGTATDSNFNYYYCYVSNVNGHEYGTRDSSCTTTWHSVSSASLLGTVSLPTDLPDGDYVAHLIGKDKAGNASEATQQFVLDNTAPVSAITAPTSNMFKGIVTLSGTVSDINPDHYYFVVKNSSGTVVAGPGFVNQASVSSWNWNTASVADGTYTIDLEARDQAGNKDSGSVATMSVIVDNTLPTVSISSPSNGQALSVNTTSHMLAISGTATDSNFNYYYCYITNAQGEVGTRDPRCVTAWWIGSLFHSAFAQSATGTSGSLLGKVDLTGLADGEYTAHLVAHDLAGNISETATTFTLDDTAPAVSDNFNVSMPVGHESTLAPTISGVTGAIYSWKVSDPTLVKPSNSVFDQPTLTVGPAPAGTYTAELTVTDPAGNPTVVTYSVTIVTPASVRAPSANTSTPGTTTAAAILSPSVLGDSIVASAPTPAATPESVKAQDNSGQVKGDETTNIKTTTSNLNSLSLGWWWLPIIIVFLGLIWFFLASLRHKRTR